MCADLLWLLKSSIFPFNFSLLKNDAVDLWSELLDASEIGIL